MSIKIRRYRGKNTEVLKKLKSETLPEDNLDFKTSMIWVAYDGKKPVGFAGMQPSNRWENCGYLNFAGVLYSHQGLGIQKKLIRARVREAKKLGWDILFSDTWRNPPSENSLISLGFKTYRPQDIYRTQSTTYWRLIL